MRLKQWERVLYTPNPLVEVVGQVRFPRILEIDDQLPLDFQKEVRNNYPLFEIQEEMFSVQFGQGASRPSTEEIPKQSIYHFLSADKALRLSLNSEYIALTCIKYERWENFIPELMKAIELVEKLYQINLSTRIGLRYRDLIVREQINLAGIVDPNFQTVN